MKRMIINSHGEADNFELSEGEPTPLKSGYVRVRVRASTPKPGPQKMLMSG